MAGAIKQGVTRAGTARELADHGVGYTASGESQWSRNSANSTSVKMLHHEDRAPSWARIEDQTAKLAALERRMKIETDPERRAKVLKNISIKSAYIARLKSE